MATHLIQKPGESTWYVRMAVPVDVRHAFGGLTKLVKTTGTSNKAEAMHRRLPILGRWKAEIAAARQQSVLARELWRPDTAQISSEIEARVTARFMDASRGITIPVPTDPVEKEARKQVLLAELYEDARNLETSGVPGVVELIQKSREAMPDDPFGRIQNSAGFMRELALQLATSHYGLSPAEAEEARAIVVNPAVYKPASPITPRRLEAFREHRVKSQVAAKTIDQQESKLTDLSAYLKSEGKRLDKSIVSAWLASKPLSSKTKIQYLLAGSTFWQWAVEEDGQWKSDFAGMDNPFTGHKLPKRRVAEISQSARKAFTTDELTQVLNAAREQGSHTLCDLIMLGAYTGCRIEELAQLKKDSVVTIEGIRSFAVSISKTVAGVRQIPIHPELDAVVDRLIEQSSDGYLLPSSGGNKYGIRSDSLSKAFGRLKTSLGYGEQHVFHSVRSMVITQLLRASVPGNVVANIVGHETGLVTFDVYDEGASPAQKLGALLKLPTV